MLRNTLLLALALSGISALKAQTVSNIQFDHVSHSSVRVSFTASIGSGEYRTRYIASPGTCTSGTGGMVQTNFQATPLGATIYNPMYVILGGLAANTTYQICPEVTSDGNTWSSGAGATFTTLPLPAVHPAAPIAPTTFDTSYPDITGYNSVTVASDCSDFMSDLNNARSVQASVGTVINIPAGTTCSAAPYTVSGASADAMRFSPNDVSTTNSTINLPNHGLTEGQGIIFGTNYSGLPAVSGCPNAIQTGQLYYAHVVDANTIQVYCGGPQGSASGVQLTFSNQGSTAWGPSTSQLYVAPWPRRLQWIIIRTATPDSQFVPANTRVNPSWVPKMASFVMPSSRIGDTPGQTVLWSLADMDNNVQFPIGNIRFMGIEFTTEDYAYAHTSTDPQYWSHLFVSEPWNSNIILDRCYIHLPGTPNRVHRGFFWDGMAMGIVDSYFDNLEYFHSMYTGLQATKATDSSFTIAPGTHHLNGTAATLSATLTASFSGTGTGRAFVYFDMNNSNALTVAYPAGITGGACTGATCALATAPGTNWSCNYSDSWPSQDAAGRPAVGEVACVDITNGAITGIYNADAWTSQFDTEGANFMIGGNGPGPYTVKDTFFEGAGLMWHHDDSGADIRTRGDYLYYRNMFYEPRKLMFGSTTSNGLRYYVRQPLEWKSGQRILINGNIFDGNWVEDNPASATVALTSVHGQGITDADLENNTFRHVPGLVSFGVTENNQWSVTPPAVRFRFHNNLAWDINAGSNVTCNDGTGGYSGPTYWVANGFTCSNGWVIQGPNASEDFVVDHNTIVGNIGRNPSILSLLDIHTEGVSVTNNLFSVGGNAAGGIVQDGSVKGGDACIGRGGEDLMNCKFTPSYVFDHNVLIGNGASQSTISGSWFPDLTNYVPSDPTLANIGWESYNGPLVTTNNFRIKSTFCSGCGSPAKDGLDVGADIDALEAAQGKVVLNGVPVSSITSTAATVSFVAPDTAGCSVDYSSSDATLINSFTRVTDAGGTRVRNVPLAGLSSKTTYYYRVNCSVEQPTGAFRTQ